MGVKVSANISSRDVEKLKFVKVKIIKVLLAGKGLMCCRLTDWNEYEKYVVTFELQKVLYYYVVDF